MVQAGREARQGRYQSTSSAGAIAPPKMLQLTIDHTPADVSPVRSTPSEHEVRSGLRALLTTACGSKMRTGTGRTASEGSVSALKPWTNQGEEQRLM